MHSTNQDTTKIDNVSPKAKQRNKPKKGRDGGVNLSYECMEFQIHGTGNANTISHLGSYPIRPMRFSAQKDLE